MRVLLQVFHHLLGVHGLVVATQPHVAHYLRRHREVIHLHGPPPAGLHDDAHPGIRRPTWGLHYHRQHRPFLRGQGEHIPHPHLRQHRGHCLPALADTELFRVPLLQAQVPLQLHVFQEFRQWLFAGNLPGC